MPAVGKTYWGNKIARQYNLPFIDLDTFIEEQERMSIIDLFAVHGEKGFREKEHSYLGRIIAHNTRPLILAAGGGTPCFYDNMAQLKNAGTVVYLRADISYLVHNMKNSAATRPLLNGRPDIGLYLEEMLKTREPVYGQAHYILDVKNISLVTFDKIIGSLCTHRH
jgi:shikimate kinase